MKKRRSLHFGAFLWGVLAAETFIEGRLDDYTVFFEENERDNAKKT